MPASSDAASKNAVTLSTQRPTRGFRNLGIGPRLLAAFGLVVVLIAAIVVVGVIGGNSQSNAAAQLSKNVRLTREAMQVKFRGADFNGWETAYGFDIIGGLKDATSNSAPSRAAFLASVASFRQETGVLSADQLTAAERVQLNGALGAFNAFMTTDNTVIADYRTGTAEGVRAANDLEVGRQITLYDLVSSHIESLAALIDTQSA